MIRRLKSRIARDFNEKVNLKKHALISKLIMGNMISERKDTYCSWLWDSVFIDQFGNVYCCCHYGPGILGNVYRNDLSTIWRKGFKLKRYRWMSSHKCLPCFFGCNIPSKKENDGLTTHHISKDYPVRVWMLFSEFCNIDCIMCGQDHRSRVTLDHTLLKKRIEWEKVNDIEIQGGEILAIKKAKEMYLWLTQEKGKKVNLITNGNLINDEWADHFVKGSKWIQVSVNAASQETHELVNRRSKFDRVMDNIKKMILLKRSSGSDIQIIYKFTIIPENIHEIGDAIELAAETGCDEIAFGYDHKVPFILSQDKELYGKVKDKIHQLVNSNLHIHIETKRLEQIGLLGSNDINCSDQIHLIRSL